MPEVATARQVMYITREGWCLAVVENPEAQPWRVVKEPLRERGPESEGLPWEVVIFLPSYLKPDTLVFASRRDARAWIAKPEDSSSDDADVKRSNDATARFDDFAATHGLDPNSPEAVERAHDEGVVGSVWLYKLRGCEGDHQVVEDYLGDWSKLGKDWTPKSCKAYVRGTVYAETYGWTKTGDETGIVGEECRPDIPHEVKSIKAEH
jgi:hypothetical protein